MRKGRAVAVPASAEATIGFGSIPEVRFCSIRKRPWGWFSEEICDPVKKTRIWLGTFDFTEEAARAYDATAINLRGCKAKTNFPTPCPPFPAAPSLSPPPPLPFPTPPTLGSANHGRSGRPPAATTAQWRARPRPCFPPSAPPVPTLPPPPPLPPPGRRSPSGRPSSTLPFSTAASSPTPSPSAPPSPPFTSRTPPPTVPAAPLSFSSMVSMATQVEEPRWGMGMGGGKAIWSTNEPTPLGPQ